MELTQKAALAALVLGLLGVAGCETSRTEVIVVVDSDLSVPGELDQILIDVVGPEANSQMSMGDLASDGFPRTLGLVHKGGRLGPFRVTVQGRRGGAGVVTRTAEFTFVPKQTLVLPIFLLRECLGVSCGAGQTCGEGGCQSEVVDPADMARWNGRPPRLDGGTPPPPEDSGPRDTGTPDTGRDTGVPDTGMPDTGMTDAGTDTGMPDAGADTGTPDAGTDAGMEDACVPMAEACNDADDDCDGAVDEGFDLTSDEMNCGACGATCPAGGPRISGGECVDSVCVLTCDTGYGDCSDAPGCETNLQNDESNCGVCDMVCTGPGARCRMGSCM